MDYKLGISQLKRCVSKEGKLKKPFFGYPKEAKAVLDSCTINGKPLGTVEQLETLEADCNYKSRVQDFKKLWSKHRELIGAPSLKDDITVPLRDFKEKLSQIKEVLDWEEKFGSVIASKVGDLDIRRQEAYRVEFLQEFLPIEVPTSR